MNSVDTYDVKFSGLSNGLHSFNWELKGTFFSDQDSDDISDAQLKATLALDKSERMMNLAFSIEGKVKTICDHCGDDVWIDLTFEEELIARFAEESDFSNDEVIFVGNNEYKLDVGPYLYEFSILHIPTKRLHADGKCNPEVEGYFGSHEVNEEDEVKEKDPRWKALEQLKK